jgi:hypothetical protein
MTSDPIREPTLTLPAFSLGMRQILDQDVVRYVDTLVIKDQI